VAAAATPSGASAAVAAGSGSPSRRPRSSAVNSDLHHLRHSGDSGDSGVSSPGPPSSEASEQKHSGEEEEEEEDADEEDDRGSDNLSYMDRVVMEVVESETVYVRDLQQVVEVMLNTFGFISPIRFRHFSRVKEQKKLFCFFFCFSHHVQQQS
jgi:hypothetical protein